MCAHSGTRLTVGWVCRVQSSKEVQNVQWYIIMPFHGWKSRWDLVIMGLVSVRCQQTLPITRASIPIPSALRLWMSGARPAWMASWRASLAPAVHPQVSAFLIPFDIAYREVLEGDCESGGYLSSRCTFGPPAPAPPYFSLAHTQRFLPTQPFAPPLRNANPLTALALRLLSGFFADLVDIVLTVLFVFDLFLSGFVSYQVSLL